MSRRLCECSHRYADHARGGTACLVLVDDPDRDSPVPCWCHEYHERPGRLGPLSVEQLARALHDPAPDASCKGWEQHIPTARRVLAAAAMGRVTEGMG